MAARKKRKKKPSMPQCNHMADMHWVQLPTVAALSLVSAATYAVRNGYGEDEDAEFLEPAVNAVLDACCIDCTFEDDGTMVLTYDADAYRKRKGAR